MINTKHVEGGFTTPVKRVPILFYIYISSFFFFILAFFLAEIFIYIAAILFIVSNILFLVNIVKAIKKYQEIANTDPMDMSSFQMPS